MREAECGAGRLQAVPLLRRGQKIFCEIFGKRRKNRELRGLYK